MTDLVIRAPSRAAMEQGFAALDLVEEDGSIRSQGRFSENGTEWAAYFADTVYAPTGGTVTDPATGGSMPEYAQLPGSYLALRWNGDEDRAPFLAATEAFGIEIVWTSESGDPPPDHIPRFA